MIPDERKRLPQADQLQLCVARSIYRCIDEPTASGSKTWRQWFEERYGEPYDDYVKRMKKK